MNPLAKLEEYLGYFERQGEPGLIVFDDPSTEAPILERLRSRGYLLCATVGEARSALDEGRSVLIGLGEDYTESMNELVSRLADERLGRTDSQTAEARVLLAGRKESVAEIERTFAILNVVGMVERF